MQVKIDGAPVTLMGQPQPLTIDDVVEQRSATSFVIVENAGATHYQQGQKLEIVDDDGSDLYTGFIDQPQETLMPGTTQLRTQIAGMDNHYLADKRLAAKVYTQELAGDIASDLVETILSQEGVIGYHVQRTETTQADWQGGSYNLLSNPGFEGVYVSGVAPSWTKSETGGATGVTFASSATAHGGSAAQSIAATNTTDTQYLIQQSIGAGLVVAGQTYRYSAWIQVTQAFSNSAPKLQIDWRNAGGFLSSSILALPTGVSGWTYQALTATAPAGADRCTVYVLFTVSNSTNSGTLLVDDAQFFSTTGGPLNTNLVASAAGDLALAKVATDSITTYNTLPLFNGGTFSTLADPGEPDTTQEYTRTWDDNSAANQTLFGATGVSQSVANGLLTVTAASGQGARSRLDAAAARADFWLSVDIVIPSSGSAGVVYRTTGWQNAADTYGYTVMLSTTQLVFGYGTNTSTGAGAFTTLLTFTLATALTAGSTHCLRVVVQGTAHSFYLDGIQQSTTQTDSTYSAAGQFGLRVNGTAATFDNLVLAPLLAAIELAGYRRNWDDNVVREQTLFAGGSPSQTASNGTFQLGCVSGNTSTSRLDAAPALADFVLEVDVTIPAGSGQIGVVYRTTGWQATPETYAYVVGVTTTSVFLGRGTNTSSGAGAFTSISSVAVTLTAGTVHRLKVTATGNTHTVALDGMQKINTTDATYPAAGQFGLRLSGGTFTGLYDNLGIIPATSGTWVSPVINPTGPGSVGATSTVWTATLPTNTSLTMEAAVSTDSGSTFGAYAACTQGGAIPGLSPLQSLSAVRLKFRLTLATTDATVTPSVSVMTLSIQSPYVSGSPYQRISPLLSLAPADVARTATVSWEADTPAGTTLLVETSSDNGATWQSLANGGQIAGINYEPMAYTDVFDSLSSGNFTQSGSAVWTWDTMENLLLGSNASGGSDGFLIYSAYAPANLTLSIETTSLTDLALVARKTGTTYYRLHIQPTALSLAKVVVNVETVLATMALSLVDGELHRWQLTINGTSLQAWMDNTLVLSVTDSAITAAGGCGLQLPSPLSGTNTATLEWLMVAPLGDALASTSVLVRQTFTADTNRAYTPTLHALTVKACTRYIQDGPLIQQAIFNYAHVSACLDALTQNATSDQFFTWLIRPDLRLQFGPREMLAAAWAVWTNAEGIAPDVLHEPTPPTVTKANPLYRNQQVLTGGLDTTLLQTETRTGDGTTTSFTVGFPLAQAPQSITVNGVAKTVGLKGHDTGKDWYYAPGDAVLSQDTGGTRLAASDLWQIQYYGLYQLTVTTNDPALIAERQAVEGGGSGIVEEVADAGGTTTQAAIFQQANGYLAKYGVIGRTLVFETWRAGLKAGTLLRVKLPAHDLNNVLMLIQQVHVSDEGNVLKYQITAIEGPVLGTWTQFFIRMLALVPASIDSITVGQNGIVAITESVSETWTWNESVTETVFVCPIVGPSTLIGPSLVVC